ncbi:hypothetical protein BDZ89DRAFT_1170251 [Hymenopellis radicata]|nr:hypothetical protein BDZ89DRAFT_1170251 [Hymenopellis radicata]
MVRLTAVERAQADELGQKIFDWIRRTEEHYVVLRTDPNAYAEAWQQYAAKAPQIGTIPARDKYEEHISLGEKLLEKKCVTFYDHVEAANTLAYLVRLQLTLAADLGWPVQVAIGEYVTAKSTNHRYAPSHFYMPQNPHPLLLEHFGPARNTPTSSVPPAPSAIEYPVVLPGQPFSRSDILHYPRESMLPTEVAFYKTNPGPLSELTFTTSGEMGDEAFRVSSFLTIGTEKIFYLVFADEGAEAVAYSSSDFFTLLESSQRVITDGSNCDPHDCHPREHARAHGLKALCGLSLIEDAPNLLLFDTDSQYEWNSELDGIPRTTRPRDKRVTMFGYLVAWFLGEYAGLAIPLCLKRHIDFTTVFITHATLLSRYLCAGSVGFYHNLKYSDVDREAGKCRIYHRYCIERSGGDVVSHITADEAECLPKLKPDGIIPNGLNIVQVPSHAPILEPVSQVHGPGCSTVCVNLTAYNILYSNSILLQAILSKSDVILLTSESNLPQ